MDCIAITAIIGMQSITADISAVIRESLRSRRLSAETDSGRWTEIHIYKKLEGSYQRVYTYENEIDFAHTLVGGILRGVPTFLAGVRRRDAELFYVQYKEGAFVTKEIDRGVGPANLCLVNEENRDLIIAANHTANEAAVYIVED